MHYPWSLFQENNIFLSTGCGFEKGAYDILETIINRKKVKYVQLIYDYTPVLFPQYHLNQTIQFYRNFLFFAHKNAKELLFGGCCAEKDGIEFAKNYDLPIKKTRALKFGSNIILNHEKNKTDNEILSNFGIKDKFIIVVGTIEARKNHESLYYAFLRMLEHKENPPQMIFCGFPGWKTEDLVYVIKNDARVKGKIILCTPEDDELDCLYRHCVFTILASVYEGWSLTLPESLNYGKFCLAADTPPLKEIGGNLIDYVKPYDVVGWAEKIKYYISNNKALEEKELKIKNEWRPVSWRDCSIQIKDEIDKLSRGERNE